MTEITPQEQAEFDRQGDVADELLSDLVDRIPEDVDSIGVLYALWVAVTFQLALAGWTAEELTPAVQHYVASATTTGVMQ